MPDPCIHVHHERLRAVVPPCAPSKSLPSDFQRNPCSVHLSFERVLARHTADDQHLPCHHAHRAKLCHVTRNAVQGTLAVASLLRTSAGQRPHLRPRKQVVLRATAAARFCNARRSCAVAKIKHPRYRHVKQRHQVLRGTITGDLASAQTFCLMAPTSVLFLFEVCVYGWPRFLSGVFCYSYTRKLLQ